MKHTVIFGLEKERQLSMARAIIATVLSAALFASSANIAVAQERLRIAWAGFAATHLPLWIAHEKGFMKKYGLDPDVIFFGASPTATQALLAGELDIVVASVPAVVNARLGGADTVLFLTFVPTFVDHIIAAPNITHVEQLKGRIGGVNRLGSVADMGLRLTLRRVGIDPEKDTKIVVAGGGNPERLAALSKGIVHFTLLNEPFIKEAERLGFRDLLDIATLKIPFHWNGCFTREAIINAKRPALAKFARAVSEGIHYTKTQKEGTKAIMAKNLKMTDPEGLERAYKTYSTVFPELPYPYPEGVKTLLDDMAPQNPKAAVADSRTFVDMSFVRELESSGFIKQLYKR